MKTQKMQTNLRKRKTMTKPKDGGNRRNRPASTLNVSNQLDLKP